MGERGNIKIGQVYLYTHWGGAELKQTLQKALKRKQRWNDEPYLTRIIFCEMIKGEEDEETGYGISTEICDNEYNILQVDVQLQKVFELNDEEKIIHTWTFEEFIKLKLEKN